jgi:hypothetical protein
LERFEGFLELLHINEGVAPIQKDHAVPRIDLLGLLQLGNGFFIASQLVEYVCDVDDHADVRRIERRSAAKLIQRRLQLAIANKFDAPPLVKDGAGRVAFKNGVGIPEIARSGASGRLVHRRHREPRDENAAEGAGCAPENAPGGRLES